MFRYPGLEPLPYQPKNAVVGHSMLHKFHGPFVAHVVKEPTDVRIEYPIHTLSLDAHIQRVQRLVWTAPRAKPIRESPKVHLIDLVEDSDYRVLDDLIFQRRDAQRPLPAIGFRDIDSARRLSPICSTMHAAMEID